MTDPEFVLATRQYLNESQSQFGERMGYSQTAVSRWELGTLEVPKLVVQECRRLTREAPIANRKPEITIVA